MKKLILLSSIILYCLSSNAQTLSASATTVNSGGTVTLTGSGESNSVYFIAETSNLVWNYSPSTNSNNLAIALTNPAPVYYNLSTHAPTSLHFILTNTSGVVESVTYRIAMTPYDNVNLKTLPEYDYYFTVTVNPAPIQTYWNVAESGPWTRNNCGTGYTGSTVSYTVPANTYSSTTSQAAANQLAINAGQAYANTNGTCTAIPPIVTFNISSTNTTRMTNINVINDGGVVIGSGTGVGQGRTVSIPTLLAPATSSPQYPYTQIPSSTNSTITLIVQNTGYMPTQASINMGNGNFWGSITSSGTQETITFSGVNITSPSTATITLY